MYTLATSIQHCTKGFSQCTQERKFKVIQNAKIKQNYPYKQLSLFMLVENPKHQKTNKKKKQKIIRASKLIQLVFRIQNKYFKIQLCFYTSSK